MSQLILDLNDINRARKELFNEYRKGNIQRFDFLDYDLKYLQAAATRENAIVQLVVSAAKHGKKILSAADRNNLLDSHVAINTGDPEIEMIKCPDDNDKLITRQHCLDYSGRTENMEACQGCIHYGPTRRALLPDN